MKKAYEVLCTILLILIIGLCLLQIAGVSASFHERLSEKKEEMDDTRIAMSYYLTKFRHFDSKDVLRIEDNKVYIREYGMVTCIFVEDGVLYESSVIEGMPHSKDFAFEIAKVDSVELTQKDHVVTVTVAKNESRRSVNFGFRAAGGQN